MNDRDAVHQGDTPEEEDTGTSSAPETDGDDRLSVEQFRSIRRARSAG